MKNSMVYDFNQANLLKIWEIEAERENHIRRLNTIYQEKSKSGCLRPEQDHEKRGFIALHLKNKEIDSSRKQRMVQEKINYENQILRSKLVDASIPRVMQQKPKSHSVNSWKDDGEARMTQMTYKRENSISENYLRRQEKIKITSENTKMFIKLATIKSDLMSKLNIRDHQKRTSELKEKLQRKSPKKVKMLRSFFKRRHLDLDSSLMPIGLRSQWPEIQNEEEVM